MEHWKRWVPHQDIQEEFFLTKTVVEKNRTIIYGELLSRKTRDLVKYVKFDYKNFALAYRETDEGNRLTTIRYLGNKYGVKFYGPWEFFIVENSDYIKWFKEECGNHLKKKEYLNIEHQVFFINEVIDIICTKKPVVTVSNYPII